MDVRTKITRNKGFEKQLDKVPIYHIIQDRVHIELLEVHKHDY